MIVDNGCNDHLEDDVEMAPADRLQHLVDIQEDYIQRSDEWKTMRNSYIGGSDIATVLGHN